MRQEFGQKFAKDVFFLYTCHLFMNVNVLEYEI